MASRARRQRLPPPCPQVKTAIRCHRSNVPCATDNPERPCLLARSCRADSLAAGPRAAPRRKMGISLTPEEQFEIFGKDKSPWYAGEAEQGWGDPGDGNQSQGRTAAYTKDGWIAIKREADDNIQQFADALRAGETATSEAAMDLAEAHRQHISRWF